MFTIEKRWLKNRTLLTLAVAGLLPILTVLVFWSLLPSSFRINESGDYESYYLPVAENLLMGNGLTLNGELATTRPPGFPLILAGLFVVRDSLGLPHVRVMQIFILCSMSLSSLFLFLIAERAWGNTGGVIASLFWATYPPLLWLTKQPNSEVPFLLVFTAAICVLFLALTENSGHCHWGKFLFAGILIGSAMLIRPIAIGLGLCLSLGFWVFRRPQSVRERIIASGMILLGNFIAVLPWEFWVFYSSGEIIPISTLGIASIRDGMTFGVVTRGFRVGTWVPEGALEFMSDASRQMDHLQSVRDVVAFLVHEFHIKPLAVVEFLGLKLLRSWYGTDSQRFEMIIAMLQIVYTLFFLAGFRIAVSTKGASSILWKLLAVVFGYFWLMNALSTTLLRYFVPAISLLFAIVPVLFLPSLVSTKGD